MNKTQRQLTGIFLIAVPMVMMTLFTILQMTFEYPDILRQSTDHVLRQFQAGGNGLILTWYAFMFTAILFVPLVILLHQVLARENSTFMFIATTIGVLAGVVQFLGLIRWPFLVPYLAKTYLDPNSTAATRNAVEVVFQTFNQYAGVAVGEHLGYLFTGSWTFFVAMNMFKSAFFKPWLAWLGIVAATGIVIGIFEPFGFALAGVINALSYMLWAIWLVVMGIFLLRVRE